MSQTALLNSTAAGTVVLAEATQCASAGIVSRTVLQTPEARVTLFTFAQGQELTQHTSRRRALIQVLDGTCEFFFNNEWQPLKSGTFLHLPPAHSHAVRASTGPFSMLLTLCNELSTTTT